ncbi:MAG: hypothetical protein V3V00_04155 [Saprospiraceae bacterium]
MKKRNNKTLILSGQDIQQIVLHFGHDLIMDSLISRLTSAIEHFDPDKTIVPVRSGLHYDFPASGLIEWMPLLDEREHVMIKVVGYHPSNPDTNGFPTILSTVSLYDTSSGHLQGLMDGVLLTALRTAAASAIASKYLAHTKSAVLGLIGCGNQAVTQLHGLSRIFDLKQVLIYDIDHSAMRSFEHRCSVLNIGVDIFHSTIDDLIKVSDIVCTASSIEVGKGPLFNNLIAQPHIHINAVGSDFPGKIEIPLDLLQKSFVCPDFTAQAKIEGECQQLTEQEIGPDIIKVLKNPELYAHIKNQHSVFDSTGWALEDQVAMELFMEYASELELGQEVEIENVMEDAKNPYHFLNTSLTKIQSSFKKTMVH